ncbi:MAG: hypothetical protein GWN07_18570 [Actinobacteria bacterium]|nr:hypothetical protein [Actinomycetota bacterium]NIU67427.1 hypothetical protein [Actinomycetota bacterium]NIV87899.1 hypothetical protein [Actinomycetota bacterium]NIW29202.1 hypothetical protein [Actinomycetota bacterium]NIX21727.1 hypothetical protein [Actinomycetota bacterium]
MNAVAVEVRHAAEGAEELVDPPARRLVPHPPELSGHPIEDVVADDHLDGSVTLEVCEGGAAADRDVRPEAPVTGGGPGRLPEQGAVVIYRVSAGENAVSDDLVVAVSIDVPGREIARALEDPSLSLHRRIADGAVGARVDDAQVAPGDVPGQRRIGDEDDLGLDPLRVGGIDVDDEGRGADVDAVAMHDVAVRPSVLEDRILERNGRRLGPAPAGGWRRLGRRLDVGLGVDGGIGKGVEARVGVGVESRVGLGVGPPFRTHVGVRKRRVALV